MQRNQIKETHQSECEFVSVCVRVRVHCACLRAGEWKFPRQNFGENKNGVWRENYYQKCGYSEAEKKANELRDDKSHTTKNTEEEEKDEEEQETHCAPHPASTQTLNKYDSSDCIDIDRLQCGSSAYGKQFQSASAATAAIEKHYRHRLHAILLRVCDYCINISSI